MPSEEDREEVHPMHLMQVAKKIKCKWSDGFYLNITEWRWWQKCRREATRKIRELWIVWRSFHCQGRRAALCFRNSWRLLANDWNGFQCDARAAAATHSDGRMQQQQRWHFFASLSRGWWSIWRVTHIFIDGRCMLLASGQYPDDFKHPQGISTSR